MGRVYALRYDDGPWDHDCVDEVAGEVTGQNRANTRALRPNYNAIGLRAEYTFAIAARKALREDVRMRIDVPLHGDGGFDFEIGDLTIDVKGSEKATALRYEVKQNRLPAAHLYVLVRVLGREAAINTPLGWCTGRELAARDLTSSDFDGTPLLEVPTDELRPMETLWALLARRVELARHAQAKAEGKLGEWAAGYEAKHNLPAPSLDAPIMFDGSGERTTKTPVAQKITIASADDLAEVMRRMSEGGL